MRKVKIAALAALVLCPIALSTQPAAAAAYVSPPTITITSGTGTTVRAVFYEHANFTGHTLTYKGSGPCTSTLTDNDYSLSQLPSSWNDKISSFRDYNSCDVKLYENINFGGAQTAWLNGGSSPGYNLPASWNDRASSFRVS